MLGKTDYRRSPGIECRRYPEYVQRERTDWCGEFQRCRGKATALDICQDCRFAQLPKAKKRELPKMSLIYTDPRELPADANQ